MVVGSIKICFYVRYRKAKQTTSIAIVNNGEIKPLTALHRKAICYELAEKVCEHDNDSNVVRGS